jgi:hypothetical protein
MRTDIEESKEKIILWISENQPKSFICRQLKCKPETLNFWLGKMNIAYNGNMGYKGVNINPSRKNVEEYIKLNAVRSCVLKQKLIEEGYKENKCEECNLTIWNGKQIPLELHHKDDNRFNNEISNLQILCCNCHAQTENYKKKKSAIK